MMKLIFYSAVYIIFHFEDLFKLQYSTLYLKNFVFKGPYIKKKQWAKCKSGMAICK